MAANILYSMAMELRDIAWQKPKVTDAQRQRAIDTDPLFALTWRLFNENKQLKEELEKLQAAKIAIQAQING